MTMLPVKIYKFFYLPWATYGTLFQNARSTTDFCQATIFLQGLLIPLFFHAKLTKTIEQLAIL